MSYDKKPRNLRFLRYAIAHFLQQPQHGATIRNIEHAQGISLPFFPSCFRQFDPAFNFGSEHKEEVPKRFGKLN